MSELSNALAREKRLRDLCRDALEWLESVGSGVESEWYESVRRRMEKAARK